MNEKKSNRASPKPSRRPSKRSSGKTEKHPDRTVGVGDSEAAYRAAIETSTDGFLVADLDGRILEVNDAYAKRSGYGREELLRMRITDIEAQESSAETAAHIQKIIRKGNDVFRTLHRTRDGTIWHAEVNASYWPIREGRFFSFIRDITERTRAERELAHSRDMMRYIIEHNRSAVAVHDRDLKYIYVSQRYLDEYKVKKKDVIGKHHYDVFPDLPQKWRDVHQRALAGEVLSAEDDPYVRADGTVDWTRWECRPWHESDGSIGGIIVYTEVITERKKAEEALRQSEERFRQLAENITEVFYISNLHTHQMIYVSPGYELVWGRSCESLYANPYSFVEAIHPAYRERVTRSLERQLQGEKTEEVYQIIRPDKSVRWIRDRAFPVLDHHGNVVRVAGLAEDITELKQSEELLRESKEKYMAILKAQPDLIFLLSKKGEHLDYYAPELTRILIEPEEFLGKRVDEVLPPETGKKYLQHIQQVLATGEMQFFEYMLEFPEGPRHFEARLVVSGKEEILAIIRDITERKGAERALKKERDKAQKYLDLVGVIICAIDSGQKITLINRKGCEILGYSENDILGKNWFDNFIPDDERDRVKGAFSSLMRGEVEPVEYFENRIQSKNGQMRTIAWHNSLLHDENKNIIGTLSSGEDVTDRKRMEEEVQRSHKLESIGILAGGIAHDFNNLLAGIMNNIYLSKMHIDKDSDAYHYMESAEKALLRSSDLTQQLLTFSRGGAPVKRTSSISDIIRETAEFALRGSSVKCEYKIPGNIRPVNVDRGQISQVIQNIIINAEQAMPGGGMIMIEIENAIGGSGTGIPQKEGIYVKITIHDQGTGIPDEHLQKIFDPFFTTKEKGRGLGLAIVHSIVKNHDGYISVKSEPGHGTTFDIYLPAFEGQTATEQAADEANQTGSGRVLIMDDEEAIRSSLGELLVHMGYDVDLARDGAEAAEVYKKAVKSTKPFDAVILDLTVPGGMGGEEALQLLREIDPNIKAVVSSGYSNSPVLANFRDYGFRGFLPKPYKSPAELNKILHGVITGLNE